jgi:hypothetical protein
VESAASLVERLMLEELVEPSLLEEKLQVVELPLVR